MAEQHIQTRADLMRDIEDPDYGAQHVKKPKRRKPASSPLAGGGRTVPLAPPAIAPDDVGALEENDEMGELERVLGELEATQTGANVKIWRLDRLNNARVFVDEIQPQEFSLKWLMDKYGGGLYHVLVYVKQADGSGRVKLAANKQIAIDGAPKLRREEPAPAAAAAAAPHMEVMMMGFTKMADSMREGFAQIASAQPKAQSLEDLLRTMTLLKQLNGAEAPPPVNPVEMMRESMKIAKEVAQIASANRGGGGDDEGEGGGGVSGILFTKLFERFLANFDQLKPAGAIAPAIPPGGIVLPGTEHLHAIDAPAAAPEQTHPELPPLIDQAATGAGEDMQSQMLSMALTKIVQDAERNTPVAEVAESVLDYAPPALLDFLETEDWWAQLQALNARASLYPVWFKQLRDEILRLDAAGDVDEDGVA